MSPSEQPTFINPTRLKNQFAYRFIRALNTLNNTKQSNHHHGNLQIYRSRRVKIAANTAMASVVGSRRAWSRAVLWKIRSQSRNQGLLRSNRKRIHHRVKTSVKRRNPNPKTEDLDPFGYSVQESKLRKLVPGVESMDSCGLMDETADYIKCLTAQVEVMRTILDHYTTT